MNDIIKKVKSLEMPGLLIAVIRKKSKNEGKEQKGVFLRMSLSTLGASILGNLLTGKGTVRAGEGTIKTGQNF